MRALASETQTLNIDTNAHCHSVGLWALSIPSRVLFWPANLSGALTFENETGLRGVTTLQIQVHIVAYKLRGVTYHV